ncbi:MAG: GspH/FimT family pseudopilin [Acidobacteriota bacterium]
MPCLRSGRERGYSLVEILLVLAIAAILLTVSIPALSQYMRSYSARVAADQFVSHLRLARHLSIARHQPVNVAVTSKTYTLPDWNSSDLSTAPSRSWDLPPTCSIVSGTATVSFQPDGTVSAGSGNIRLEIALDDTVTARYEVTVSASGKVSSTYTRVSS